MKRVVLGYKKTTNAKGETWYLITCKTGEKFWSPEPLEGGISVFLSERKQGEKYVKSDGTEGVITKNGFNLDCVIGNVQAVSNIKLAAAALAEMD